MKNSKLSILFVAYLAKTNRKGVCPLKCRLTYKKKRKEFASGLMVNPHKWNSKFQKVENDALLNSNIEILRSKILKSFISLELESDHFTVEDIVQKYLFKTDFVKTNLITYYNSYLKKLKNLIGKEIKESTYKKFEYVGNDLENFVWWKYNKKDIGLDILKQQFLEDFDFYLKTEKNQKQVTINKTIQRLRKVVRIAFAEGLLKSDPFILHKSKSAKKEVIYLTVDELELLEKYHFQLPRLNLVKDLFVFCCYTGLAYQELKELRLKHIIRNYDNKLWIKIKREKTDKNLSIPLLEKPKQIIDKYAGDEEFIFPVYSNQKINSYLKEIANIIGIEINLTHHVARKTFATTVLLYNDVPMEIVSELLGHSSIQITQDYYGKILQKKVGMEMNKLSEKLK